MLIEPNQCPTCGGSPVSLTEAVLVDRGLRFLGTELGRPVFGYDADEDADPSWDSGEPARDASGLCEVKCAAGDVWRAAVLGDSQPHDWAACSDGRASALAALQALRGQVAAAQDAFLEALFRARAQGHDVADGLLDPDFRVHWTDAARYFERSEIPQEVLEEIDDTLYDLRDME